MEAMAPDHESRNTYAHAIGSLNRETSALGPDSCDRTPGNETLFPECRGRMNSVLIGPHFALEEHGEKDRRGEKQNSEGPENNGVLLSLGFAAPELAPNRNPRHQNWSEGEKPG